MVVAGNEFPLAADRLGGILNRHLPVVARIP